MQYCTVLYCTVLYCTVLYCTVRYGTVRYCAVLYCTALHCTALHCTALHCTALHCTALHCTARHGTVRYGTGEFFFTPTSRWRPLTVIDWKLQKCSEWYWTLQRLIFSLPVNWFSSLRPSEAFSGRFSHCYSSWTRVYVVGVLSLWSSVRK